jgi:hypothetical protein
MKKIALATLLFFTAAMAAPAPILAQQRTSPLAIPVTGTGPAGTTFAGTFQLQRFAADQGQLVASGLLTGVVTTVTSAGTTTTSVARTVAMPAAVTQATCDILHLDLGPLDLNILGLQIDLSRIVLDITAQSGAGNLLGNLLCAVANLLNSPGPLADLLNRILAILG